MTYKKILVQFEKQQDMLHCIDKKLAVVSTDMKRINGTILKHEKKNEEQDKVLLQHSNIISGIKGKMAIIAVLIGGAAGWFFNILNKLRGG